MTKALIIVDVQNDFMEGGALGIKGANNAFAKSIVDYSLGFDHVIATQDWHPYDHCSFKHWPPHCVQFTRGAELATMIQLANPKVIIRKGWRKDCESYSAFADENDISSGLGTMLMGLAVDEIHVVGLALDYCVKATVLDAIWSVPVDATKRLKIVVPFQLTRSVDLSKALAVMRELQAHGVQVV